MTLKMTLIKDHLIKCVTNKFLIIAMVNENCPD